MAKKVFKPSLEPDQVLDERYRIQTVLARGGFSFIYLARREDEGDIVAVKVMHHEAMQKDPAAARRFEREAGIAMEMRHPHHVRVYDFGMTPDGQPYLVLERLHGDELEDVFETSAPLPQKQVATILEQTLEGLAEMHGHGVAHRDLKPPNVFLCDTDDGSIHVKLIDYGLAKVLSSEHPIKKANLTTKDIVVGTPGYMAPEMLTGEKITTRVDLYAAGIIAYELLTGKKAYSGTQMDRAIAQSQGNPPHPPSPLGDSPLWPVIDKLLERDADARYQTAEEALADLREIDFPEPSQLKATSARLGVVLAALVLAIVVVVVVLLAL